MRLLPLALLSACAIAGDDTSPAVATSVRERLAEPTHLALRAGANTGAITVRPYGTAPSRIPLVPSDGELTTVLAADGELTFASLGIGFAPIALPSNSALAQVRLELRSPTSTTAFWTGEDAATAHAQLAMALSWAIVVDGSTLPLNGQALTLPVDLALNGDGQTVTAAIAVDARGELWSWSSLVELDDLSLDLSLASRD